MDSALTWLARLVTARPWLTLLALLIVTVALGYGAVFRAPPPETRATLPQGSAVAEALHEIEDLFGATGEASVVTLLFRGDALTPGGLAQMDSLVNEIAADPSVAGLLAPGDSVIAPSQLVMALLRAPNFDSVSQADIDNLQGPPEILGAIDAMTGEDIDGTPVAVATIRVLNTGDERVEEAERRIYAIARAAQGPLTVSSVSPVIIEDAYVKATEEGMAPLVGLAFLLIAALILLFMRTLSDLALTLAGLLTSIIWIVGAEGWLGPNALGLTGPPNSLTTMVPIIIIGLTVDYAIQIVSHYREQRNAGEDVLSAVRIGFRHVAIPLLLAAITTIVSLLTSLFSAIEIVNDFGIIAGMGVGMSLIVLLTLVPAGRTIIDRRREARGRLEAPRPIANALPGVSGLATLLGRSINRAPGPYLAGVLIVTAVLGYAATDLESEFSIRDILPRGGDLLKDMETLDVAVGGATELTTVLLKAEATETRTLLNMQDLSDAFSDERTRPGAAAGPIQASFELLVRDWTQDSGQPGDKYDSELAALFQEASAGVELDPVKMQEFVDRLETIDPALSHVLVDNPQGLDSILLQFPAYSGDSAQTKLLQSDLEGLWFGNDDVLTATSESIISVTVTDSITESQTQAVTTTILAALTVLALFFWVTVRQPGLAVVAVGPIVLVLISVLGTMALLGIPYTIITSIIATLSIGIGVDYTIHMIHRYREEYSVLRDPEQAAVRTLATTGSALLGSALTTALGLGVLVASPLAASQQFGFTAAITIAYSLIVSILVIPAAMTFWGAYQNMKLRSNVRRWAEELDVEIEAIHLRHEQDREQP